jgi:hypothetical protein
LPLLHLLKHLLLRKKKRKLTPSLLLQHQHQHQHQLPVRLHPAHQLPKQTLKAKPKPLPLKRTTKSLLTQLQLRSDLEEGDDCFCEELALHVAYRRPELVQDAKIVDDDDELPEHIRWRLFLARQIALAKYREAHG